MTTREQIQADIDRLDPDQLDELHGVVQQMLHKQPPTRPLSISEKAQRIQIEGPADLSTHWERYLNEDTVQLLSTEGEG